MSEHVCGLSAEQYETLMQPINGTRIASRNQGGKALSYLESWDVRAHLIRTFGFLGFDAETIETHHVADREYASKDGKEMVEVVWFARFRLIIKCSTCHWPMASFIESAVGSASGPASMLGEHHDNAAKTAASDALKRCAINLGSQFGLSLYDGGSRKEVIKRTLIQPEGVTKTETKISPEKAAALENSVGVKIDTPQQTAEAVAEIGGEMDAARAAAKEGLGATEVEQTPGAEQTDTGPTSEPTPIDRPPKFEVSSVETHADDDEPLLPQSKLGKAMFASIRESDWTEADRLENVSAVIGRTVTSSKEMTKRDARIVLARLDWEKAS